MVGAILLMLILLILIPVMVKMGQNESKWTAKQQNNTQAFHLAELALERGYQQLILTTSTFFSVSTGVAVANFNFDTTYTDPAGEYQIRLSSGPGSSVYITAVGRDRNRTEIRSIKAQYAGTGVLSNSIYAEGTVSVGASGNVHWAPILSHNPITSNRNFPRLYSTANISKDANGATPPNTDNSQ